MMMTVCGDAETRKHLVYYGTSACGITFLSTDWEPLGLSDVIKHLKDNSICGSCKLIALRMRLEGLKISTIRPSQLNGIRKTIAEGNNGAS